MGVLEMVKHIFGATFVREMQFCNSFLWRINYVLCLRKLSTVFATFVYNPEFFEKLSNLHGIRESIKIKFHGQKSCEFSRRLKYLTTKSAFIRVAFTSETTGSHGWQIS